MITVYFKLIIKLLKHFVSLVFAVFFIEKKNNVALFFTTLGATKTNQPKNNSLAFAKTKSVFKPNNPITSHFALPFNLITARFKKLALPFTLFFAIVTSQNLVGQVATLYSFQQTTGTYTEITGGTLLATASANSGVSGLDNNIYNITIPFTFRFNNADYTSLNISTNGFITFGATAPAGTNYTPISNTATYAGAISAWGRDLSGMFNVGGRTSTLRWQTIGSSPNQQVVIQFKNWRIAYSTSTTLAPYFDFQIILNQSSNVIDIIYGPSGMAIGTSALTTAYTAQVGLRGANNTFATNVLNRTNTTAQSVNSSAVGTLNTSTQVTTLGSFSSNGTPGRHTLNKIYRWTPKQITAGTISPLTYCAGASISIPYTISGTFATNTFSAQLSNASGSFASPTLLGTSVSTAAGTISGTIPAGTASGASYRVRVISSNVYNLATPNTANLTIDAQSVGGTASSGQTICSNTQPSNLTLSGNTGSIQWQSSTNNSTWTNISGATASPLTSAQMGALTSIRYYRALVTNGSCSSANSSTVTINIGAATTPSVTISSSPSGAICAGTNVAFTAVPSGTNGASVTDYNWKVNGSSVQTGASNTYNTTGLTNGQQVSCVITVGPGCVSPSTATSNTLTITVNALPTAVSVSGAGTFCNNTTLTASNGSSGTMYYQGNTSGGTSITTAATSSVVSSSGTYYFRARSAAGCWGPEGSAVVTINTTPIAPVASAASAIGSSTFVANWAAAAGATSYSLDVSTANNFSSFVSGFNNLSVGNVLTYNVTGLSPSTTYYYRVRASSTCGTSVSSNTITVATTALVYCQPTHATGGGSDQIVNVALGNLVNASSTTVNSNYIFYNALTVPDLIHGNSQTLSVTFGTDPTQNYGAWIDYNQNGTFETSEYLLASTPAAAGASATVTITFTVPNTAVVGNTRMRVRGGDDASFTSAQACDATNSAYGETEDYIVNIRQSYKATFTNMNLGSASWCAGEVRTVSVTVTNAGTATWTNSGPDVNIGAKWNGWSNFHVRTDANNLAAGASATYTLSLQASNTTTLGAYTTPLAAGNNNVVFDIVNEGNCWFSANSGFCGTGNSIYTSPTQTIIEVPQTPGSISGSPSFCSNASGIAFSVAAVSGATNYTWTVPGTATLTAGQGTNSITVNFGSTGGNITVKAGNSCGTTATVALAVSPGAPTTPALAITASPSGSICAGTSVTFSATASGLSGSTVTNYNWLLGGVSQQSGLSNTYTNNTLANGNLISCSVTISAGCVTTTTATSNILTMTVGAVPTITSTTSGTVCGSGTTTLSAGASAGAVNWYTVSVSGSSVATGNSYTTPSISVNTTYYVSATLNGCTSSPREAVLASISAAPTSVSAGTSTTICNGGNTTLNGTATAVSGSVSASGSGGTSDGGTYGTGVDISVVVPAIPAGAVVSSTDVKISFTAIGASYQSELRVEATPPAAVGALQNDLQPSTIPTAGTTSNATLGTWGTGNPTGTWLFRFRESADDGLSPDATISNITITVNYSFPLTYSWTPSTALSSTTSQNPVANPTTTTVYTLTASSSGCSASATTTVNVTPVSVGGTASSDQTICSGNQPANITLTGNTGTIQWQSSTNNSTWNPISGATVSPLTSAQMGALSAITYYRANVTNGVCSSAPSNTITISITPVSVAGTASSSQTICTGNSPAGITLAGNTGTIQWQSSANNSTWTAVGGATLSTLSTAQMGALTATNYYRAVVTNGICSAANSNTITVTVSPVSAVGLASSSQTICAGNQPANITLASSTGAVQWQSSTDNITFNNIVGATAATLTGAQAGSLSATTYFKAIVTSSPCSAVTSNVITITVNPLVAPTVTITSDYASICSGTKVTFNATPTNGGAAPTYLWYLNGTSTGLGTATYTNSTLTNGAVVSCSMTSNYACRSVNTANSNSITISVVAFVTPVVSISAPTNSICTGTSVTFTAVPTAGGSAPTYQWKLNGANVGTNSVNYTNAGLTNGQIVSCFMTSNDACASPSTATSNSVTMTVNTMPTITASTPSFVCGSGAVTLGATASAGTINWYSLSSGGTSLATGTAYTTASLSSTQNYYVDATVAGCTTSSRTTITASVNAIPSNLNTSPGSRCGAGTVVLGAT